MIYKIREVENALLKKGFDENRQVCHKLYTYISDGKRTEIMTMTSHGGIECSGKLLFKMRRQLFLKQDPFDSLVKCPLSKEDLKRIYQSQEKVNQ